MARPTAPTKLLLWLLWLTPLALQAQTFSITGTGAPQGKITLTLFDADSSTHTFACKTKQGEFTFEGNIDAPVLASLQSDDVRQALYFYLEPGSIAVSFNRRNPAASRITGSRSNSEYRYVMELQSSANDPANYLLQYIAQNPASIYAPFILYSQIGSTSELMAKQMIDMMEDEATHTYHYHSLLRWARQTNTLAEGDYMPDFSFIDNEGHTLRFANARNAEGNTLLLFGAHWCDRCQQQLDALAPLLPDTVQVLAINIDNDKRGWDSPCLQQLAIDHIPYMMLVDREGKVIVKDLRGWEAQALYQPKKKKR